MVVRLNAPDRPDLGRCLALSVSGPGIHDESHIPRTTWYVPVARCGLDSLYPRRSTRSPWSPPSDDLCATSPLREIKDGYLTPSPRITYYNLLFWTRPSVHKMTTGMVEAVTDDLIRRR